MAHPTRDDATERLHEHGLRRSLIAVWSGGSALRPLPEEGTLVIGRGGECDVHIDHPSVSRAHAKLHVNGGAVTIEDLGSSNGTRIRGRALGPGAPARVTPEDIVEVGAARLLLASPRGAPPGVRREGAPSSADEAMEKVKRLVELVAPSDISVVLCGETGVGKDLTAETIHRLSPRSQRPMVRINCAALPEPLLESELFGHERGAFTGAVRTKPGLLEAASGGTFFFDEVAELPMTTQSKLLRVLESREILRVGGLAPRPLDVRFIAATNRDLRSLCEADAFRFDLYFRLNGITITIPPLSERAGEIRPLAEELIARQCAKTTRAPPALTPAAIAHLESHAWPGNVRELRNVIERGLVLCRGARIEPEHLPLDTPFAGAKGGHAPPAARVVVAAPEARPLKEHVGEVERQRIVDTLEQCAGNQTKAARLLGISRRTLLSRLDAWGVPRPRK